jgi:hypothetical protein
MRSCLLGQVSERCGDNTIRLGEAWINFWLKASSSLLGLLLNSIDAQLQQISQEQERQPLLRVLAGVIANPDSGLVRPIVRKFPDLDPDK